MKRTLPKYLSDGEFNYKLVRPASTLPDGRENLALYERVHRDSRFQYTPDLSYINGITNVPVMLKIAR